MFHFHIRFDDPVKRLRFLKHPEPLMRLGMNIRLQALLVERQKKMILPEGIAIVILFCLFHIKGELSRRNSTGELNN